MSEKLEKKGLLCKDIMLLAILKLAVTPLAGWVSEGQTLWLNMCKLQGEVLMEDPKSPKFLENHVSKLKEGFKHGLKTWHVTSALALGKKEKGTLLELSGFFCMVYILDGCSFHYAHIME